MTMMRFGHFSFDVHTRELRAGSRRVALRPKTAAVLHELLRRRGQIVPKRELILAVWQSEHVSDQSLFQAISELRRHLSPLDPISTQPNLGYEWTAPVRTGCSKPALAAAAALATLMLGATLWFARLPGATTPVSVASAGIPPALTAFTAGVSELRAGRGANAERLFRLTVQEHPRFIEAELLLSEALLQQGAIDAARRQAISVIEQRSDHGDDYAVIGAMDLLSRSEFASGQGDAAIDWAFEAASRARSEGYVCVAADLDVRLEALISALGTPREAVHDRLADLGDIAPAPERCAQMRPTLPETSYVDWNNDLQQYCVHNRAPHAMRA